MNLCFRYPIIYWNTARLITNSGGDESGTNYDKLATAIGKMREEGVIIELPNINSSSFGFKPDEKSNSIYCGFKSLLNISQDLIAEIINNRPYTSIKDFYVRIKPNRQSMISLIKGGAFDSLIDRKLAMGWYIWETCDKKSRLTLQNMGSLIKYNLLPEDTEEEVMARRVYEFNRYLKAICKLNSEYYRLDDRAINFLSELDFTLSDLEKLPIKAWDKVYQKWMDVFRNWIAKDKDNILKKLNEIIFKEDWDHYASGSISAWEMEALCFYYHEHELSDIKTFTYGIVDFNRLPQDPIIEKSYPKGGKVINLFKLSKIFGTCIAKNKAKGTATLLTPTGVVIVKFRKEYFSLFDRQISVRDADGTKHIVEKSWFNRGSMIMVQGIRSGDEFIAKKYASSASHQLYKIDEIKDGKLILRSERYQGEAEESD